MLLLVLAANIVVYGAMVITTGSMNFRSLTLVEWGGNLGELSLHGQSWRLLAAMFLHGGFQHILGNMVMLLITGSFLERKVGSVRFLLTYLGCGLAGSLCSAWDHPDTVSIGASGAIAGLLGVMLALKLTRRAPEVSTAWMVQVLLLNGVYSFAPTVDGVAHAGGFTAGVVVGLVAAIAQRAPVPAEGN